ncbi:binding-protein-dependent transport systems inner membrane component [Alicyclobacillus hesperidum URH17-3-68]|uniref:Peptide ABC transporter permease n=1 Tax=Alicyclobacillus hesperidum TaxID=89784 RepID=A0A1H2TEU2_9BACL|nr:ABC transporter permease [Alicyclobacillus hesperidum]KRW92065.1 peptide ABC transporter permease [Alicyclobacillus tengchongensis]EJY56036.1 binding-protein-dependent transport systems inner membrane component [Alicyclobacillus hesperidum URH17-3-68]SDW42277.1 peptide/nickel transport system permease protein [Alicyclobacillus hesperidum]GLG00850.1 peptide ABC transporter permease [Alicyclobacillus hesperidum subsp. aegles]GLV13872.1 peptide ABC transporter permease [Alicyclobacillus hesper
MSTQSVAVNTTANTPKQKAKRKNSALQTFFKNPRSLVGVILFGLFVVIAIFAPLIAPYNPSSTNFNMLQPPSASHIFGTTSLGQDVFSQFIWGTRATLIVGIGAGVLSTIIAVLIGVTAGYLGGVTDSILNAICNIFLVMPGLALLIIIESYVNNSTPYMNGLIIALTGWAWGARVMRSMAMTIASRDYIAAARLSGASTFRIILFEIVPNMTSVIASNVMYACLAAVLAESGLAYLGFENVASTSWGTMLYWSSQNGAMISGAWWWFVPPGLGIALLGTSFALMNFGIDQVTNPRLRTSRKKKDVQKLLKELQQSQTKGVSTDGGQ